MAGNRGIYGVYVMTRTEHLLVCLAEEAAEIQQAVAKALRFGLDDGYPRTDRKNRNDIMREIADLIAVTEMLQEEKVLASPFVRFRISAKKAKVKKWLKYAKQQGTIE